AAHHLNIKKPTLADLEAASGRVAMRSHYQMASYNVHASVKGLSFKLGLLEHANLLLAGASNAGLEEPGQNTAYTQTQITSYLYKAKWTLDDALQIQLLIGLRDEAAGAFARAARKLTREHRSELRRRSHGRTGQRK